MNEKFKVGDKVRIIANTYKHHFKIGEIVIIVKCSETDYEAEYLDGHDFWFVQPDDIELVTNEIAINRYGNKVVAKMGNKVGVSKCNETDEFELYTGVKIAVDRLFGKDNEVKEVKRQAKVGEYIKIINSKHSYRQYKDGDVFEVIESINKNGDVPEYVFVKEFKNPCILASEYVVLKNYKPQEVKEEKPKYYNGKVVCVDNNMNNRRYTVGKIYTFKDGDMIDPDDKILLNHTFKNLEQFNKWSSSKFIELVEDK